MTIPEDVAMLADEAYDSSDMHLGPNQTKAAVKALALAILAERQRCADACRRLAEHQKQRGQYQEAFTSNFIAQQIADGYHAT